MIDGQLLIIILTWLPEIFFTIVFLLAAFLYLKKQIPNFIISYKPLVISLIIFRILYAASLTIFQYYIWSQNKFTRLLLDSSLDQSVPAPAIFKNYFLFYSYGRFWINVLISIGIAFGFYLFLKFLKKHNERFFEEGETELGFLTALVAGWPNFVIFLPIVFISVVLVSIIRRIFWKELYTTLGWPFILAGIITLILGSKLILLLGLGVLKI